MVVALLMCACGNSVVSVTVSVVPYIMFICVMLTNCELPEKSVTFAVMLYVAGSREVTSTVVFQ